MLMLHGTLRAATQLGGGVNRKTGEVIPVRNVLQVETIDNRGLRPLHNLADHPAEARIMLILSRFA